MKLGSVISKEEERIFKELLKKSPPCIHVNCDTTGGDFLTALELYKIFKNHPQVTTEITTSCKSAGVVIWLAGTERRIKRGAWMYIHDVKPRSHWSGQVLRDILRDEGVVEVEKWLRGGIALVDTEVCKVFKGVSLIP